MVLLSCFEDLCLRTLSRLTTVFARLDYLSSLRAGTEYEHWGLARQHGQDASQQALSQAHAEAWIAVLRTPTPALYRAFREHLRESGQTAEDWFSHCRDLLPVRKGGGNELHFTAVAMALVALTENDKDLFRAA
jgi:hypothetical protein